MTILKIHEPLGVTMPLEEFERCVNRDLEITDYRALFVVVVVEPDLASAAEELFNRIVSHHGFEEDQVVRYLVRQDAEGLRILKGHNRSRDLLLKEKRLIWLQAASGDDVWFLRETAPDLMAFQDLWAALGV
jgi:hypothetical protein